MKKKQLFWLTILMLGLLPSLVGCDSANHSVSMSDPIMTTAGYVAGTEVADETGKPIHIFKSIPYAAPPVGDLRWKAPQPVAAWAGIRQSLAYSVQCSQFVDPSTINAATAGAATSSEDCLYLNVLTPAHTPDDKLPVMVWFHGGGYATGSGNNALNNTTTLPQHGVVLVTVNTRLGLMGLMAHPLLSKESPNGVSGNYMFLDIIASLQWVQQNIAAFGGDPANVTIFGESGGANKTIDMMASPLSKGLFQRAIVESGATVGTPLKTAEDQGKALFSKLGVDKEPDPLAAARALSWEKIMELAGSNVSDNVDLTVDGWFMPDTPANIFQAGKQTVVPFIVGCNQGELLGPGGLRLPFLLQYAVDLFAGANKANGQGYAYIFNQVPINWKNEGIAAFHGIDLFYVFGFLSNQNDSGFGPPNPGFSDTDKTVSDEIATIWVQFAKTGNPSVAGLITWPAYQAATDQYLYVENTLQVKSGFSTIVPKSSSTGVSTIDSNGKLHTGLDINSTIGDLMGNPDTKAILVKYIPDAVNSAQWIFTFALTLKDIQNLAPTLITTAIYQNMTDDLNAIK